VPDVKIKLLGCLLIISYIAILGSKHFNFNIRLFYVCGTSCWDSSIITKKEFLNFYLVNARIIWKNESHALLWVEFIFFISAMSIFVNSNTVSR
jgi:hypothetical protein